MVVQDERAESGEYAALRDACIHRQVPLSLGRVVGENIECRYHGARYGTHERCVHVPGQPAISPKAFVRSFPIREQHGFLWVWMGDVALIDGESAIPESLALIEKPDMGSVTAYSNQ